MFMMPGMVMVMPMVVVMGMMRILRHCRCGHGHRGNDYNQR
jgi:hypothetical protein